VSLPLQPLVPWHDFLVALSTSGNRYHAVVQLLPCADEPDSVVARREGLGVQELVRMLNERGYLILGASQDTFSRLGYRQELQQLSGDDLPRPLSHLRGELITVMQVGDVMTDNKAAPGPGGTSGGYMIAVFKKGGAGKKQLL
jgi:hypothetical protein